jgi:SAM-dependent methyltransferase
MNERRRVSRHRQLLDEVAAYYNGKLAEYGPSHRGADWSTEEAQILRFSQLSRVFEGDKGFSLLDYGCGYGALLDFLARIEVDCDYTGFDISESMIEAAREHTEPGSRDRSRPRFLGPRDALSEADYVLASGVLNVRLGNPVEEWASYVDDMIVELDRLSLKGFAFNVLTTYSDPEHMREHLYYADPGRCFDFCMRRHPRRVALLHDYGLYEFTILVRK